MRDQSIAVHIHDKTLWDALHAFAKDVESTPETIMLVSLHKFLLGRALDKLQQGKRANS